MDETLVKQIVSDVLTRMLSGVTTKDTVPVEVSARHVHLSQQDVETLFGAGHTLTCKRELSQPGQFLSEERVSIVTAKGEFRNVAVLGPARKQTQVELSITDMRTLGINAPVRMSGDTAGAAGVCLMSGTAVLEARESAIVAQSHIHMTRADAAAFGVADGQRVRVRLDTARPVTLDGVTVRVSEDFSLTMHIDFDEANACGFEKGTVGRILAADGGSLSPETRIAPPAPQAAVSLAPAKETSSPSEKPAARFSGVLSARDARELVKTCGGTLLLENGAIVTPLAKDVLRAAKVRVVCEREESPC